jgi:putative ABC transport system permease protein
MPEMPRFVKVRSFLQNLFSLRRVDTDLDHEVHSHLEMLEEENLRAGMSQDEAQRSARIEVAGIEQVKEQVREQRLGNWLHSVFSDCRFALRQLSKNVAFSSIAVLTLALGIGATTAIFSVVYGVLIRPLAVPDAKRMVQLVLKYHGQVSQDAFTYHEFRFLQEHSPWSSATAAFTHVGFNMSSSDSAERISALHVSSDYFHVLGATPFLGRVFTAEEDRDPGARSVILGYGLWQQHFSGDRSVLGTTVHLNGTPYLVVGVMPPASADIQLDSVPPAFADLQHIDLWTTLAPVADSIGSGENLAVLARLQPNLTLAQASSQLDALSQSFRDSFLEGEGKVQSVALSSVQQVMAGSVNTYLCILLAAVASLLLIACSNVSNLLLAQVAARSKEVAVRTAMGASRTRLIRQFLSESLVLSALGCLFGFVVARLFLSCLLRFAPVQLPRVNEIHVDGWTFLFSLALTVFAGAVSAMVPSFRSAKLDVHAILKESSTQSSSGRRSGVFRGTLVVAEIALSIILLIGASLLAQTFLNLLRVNPGFEPSGLLSAEIWLTGSRYHSTPELTAFYNNLAARLEQLPGVEQSAVVSMGQPLERGGNIGLKVNGVQQGSMDIRVVTPDYFETLRVAMKQGRDFSRADSATGEPIAIVNEAFVRKFLDGSDPLDSSVQTEGEGKVAHRIVGVAADVKSYVDLPEGPAVFLPAVQADFGLVLLFDVWFPTHILVRTSGDPRLFANAVDAAIREADPSIPVGRTLTMDQVLARSLAIQRFMMVVVAIFAVLALVLAAVGIYGVISFSVSQRTQEFGIRMALGADTYSVLSLVIREAARLALLGVAIGILGAIALHQAIASVLFGVHAADPGTIAASAICLLAVIFLACCIPARRAARVDPMVALRYE